MHFNSTAQEQAYQKAIKHKYKAVAFDIDGTLTELSRFFIPESLSKTLHAIPKDIPLAFCTGRPLDYIQTKLNHICQDAPDPQVEYKRWYVLAENGGIGYVYKASKQDYEAFFEVSWPEQRISKETLEAFIKDKLGMHVRIVIRDHSMVVRFHDWLYLFPKLVHLASRRTAKKTRHLLKSMDLLEELQVQDSGIGNLIIPMKSGKGKAIQHWAKQLKISVEDILVLGDQARPGENDEEFLNGKHGVAFSVGSLTENSFPLPVLDTQGRRLKGPKGTEALLKTLFGLY